MSGQGEQTIELRRERGPLSSVEVVEMRGITKKFPGVVANRDVDLDLRHGEVHALLGENGAGKTTLMNILSGFYRQDAGDILIHGERAEIRSPRDAIDLGIGMVHQESLLVDSHTVSENILIGLRDVGAFPKAAETKKLITDLEEKYEIDLKPDEYVEDLSMGEKQKVELVRVLAQGSEILILDEPTTVLTPQESETLFQNLQKLSEEGKSIFFITHKLNEALGVSDRVTVMRNGRVVGSKPSKEVTQEELADMMVGEQPSLQVPSRIDADREALLSTRNVVVQDSGGEKVVRGVSLDLESGVITGIAGISGNGQEELAEALSGIVSPDSGTILLDGRDITSLSSKERFSLGLGYIPADRKGTASVPDMSLAENLVLSSYDGRRFSKRWRLDHDEMKKNARVLMEQFDIKAPSPETPIRKLSGGNLQKTIVARVLSSEPRIVIAHNPTRGLDISSAKYIQKQLLATRDSGSALLVISEDLDELFKISDRIGVISNGEIVGIFERSEVSRRDIGQLMLN